MITDTGRTVAGQKRISVEHPPAMAPPFLWTLLMVVAMATGVFSAGNENDLEYGYWNYREEADSVNVTSVLSVTRVLDAWGKRIFREIKTLLHSEPNALLPDYSRVRPLSESVNDLFREVSLLRKRITELSHRLATLEPFLRHHGYREVGEEEAGGGRAPRRRSRVVRRRRVRVLKNWGGTPVQREI
ncbi:uncharacterized protein si:ch211-243a20.3 [Pseudoliparis swirei]|uniref:uncharacterized protein si:ch211-243a20.3 n=1 Tax=Pseudoliparis swirei TaxID=2059687 RepID=UPI0024BD7E0D|nr:uncharacterized protein si:ch211-243a20.3 [Pseudoliparis swirei]